MFFRFDSGSSKAEEGGKGLSSNGSFNFNMRVESEVVVYGEAKNFSGFSDVDWRKVRYGGSLVEATGGVGFNPKVGRRCFSGVRMYEPLILPHGEVIELPLHAGCQCVKGSGA